MPSWLSLLLLLCDRAAAQIRLLPPFPDPSICAGLCADNRCNTDTEHASGLIESACASIVAGEEQAAVGQQMLQPPAPLLEEGSNYFSFSSDTISRWEYAAGKWELHGAELAHAGGDTCAAALESSLKMAASPTCDACRPWPSMESKAAPGISAALVELSGDCAVETKALALRAHDVVLAIARRRVTALGLYSQHATRYGVPSAVDQARLADTVEHTPTVMVDKYVGLALLALRSFTNLPLRVDVTIQPNIWDDELYGSLRWLIFSAIIGPLWFVLLLFALHNLRAHVRSHGVRVSSDKVMQILLIVLITALVRTIRGCWLWGRTSMGDLVSPWGDELIRSFYLPLSCLLPMLTGSRLEMGRSRLRQIAKLAHENGELGSSSRALRGVGPEGDKQRKRARTRRRVAQFSCFSIVMIACVLRMVER